MKGSVLLIIVVMIDGWKELSMLWVGCCGWFKGLCAKRPQKYVVLSCYHNKVHYCLSSYSCCILCTDICMY